MNQESRERLETALATMASENRPMMQTVAEKVEKKKVNQNSRFTPVRSNTKLKDQHPGMKNYLMSNESSFITANQKEVIRQKSSKISKMLKPYAH